METETKFEHQENFTDDQKLAAFVSEFYADPLGYVRACFKWGEGELAKMTGPDEVQTEILTAIGEEVKKRKFDGVTPVKPLRVAISSGHGVGKSTLTGWLTSWILDTRPMSQGSVSANTGLQLSTKTWAAISRWKALAITAHWYEIGAEKIRYKTKPNSWFASALTSNEDRSESFAGQHAANSTSFYIFDEASAIPDKIFEVAEGGLTDGEPMIFLMGNPTRNEGQFYRACFGDDKHRWLVFCVDSRKSSRTNKIEIKEWEDTWGSDSDFFRVRVLGLPPRASDSQFIPHDIVTAAMKRPRPEVLADEPLVAGLDISRGGSDYTVLRFRRGKDALSIKPIRLSGEESRDSMHVVAVVNEALKLDYNGVKVSALFVDETGMGGPIGDRLRQIGACRLVIGVQFGGRSPITATANMRAYIWYQMREWIRNGGCIGDDKVLHMELTSPGYSHNAQTAILIESKESMKKRGVGSPDDGDALAVTFAQTISMKPKSGKHSRRDQIARNLLDQCNDGIL